MRLSRYELHPQLYKELAKKFLEALFEKDNFDQLANFANHIFTPTEMLAFSKRLEILKLLRRDLSYEEIKEKVKVTNSTINKMANILKNADQGFVESLNTLIKEEDEERRSKQQSKSSKSSKRFFPKKLE